MVFTVIFNSDSLRRYFGHQSKFSPFYNTHSLDFCSDKTNVNNDRLNSLIYQCFW